jgi:hypothetical protein
MQQFHKFSAWRLCLWLNLFPATLRPSSGVYNCTRNLWFYRWSVAVGALLVVVWPGATPEIRFDVRKSVHHHTIQTNQPTRCNSFTSLLLDVYMWLNMFRAILRPSSGVYNCIRSLWFYRCSVSVGALLVVVRSVATPEIRFDVCKFVHHHTIQINQPTRCNSFTSLLLDVYVWLNMFRVTLRPSSGVSNYTRSLWFVGRGLTTNNASTATLQR